MSNLMNTMPNDFDSRFYILWCKNNGLHACRYETLKAYLEYLNGVIKNAKN